MTPQPVLAVSSRKPAARREVAAVLYGRDSKHKAHAASFTASEADLAVKAAGLMGLAVWRVPEAGQALALRVPHGKVFGSGKAFTPLVKAKLMAELELAGGMASKPSSKAAPPPAAEPPRAEAGEAPDGQTGSGGTPPSSPAPQPASDSLKRPTDWGTIAPGCLVLATSGLKADGWFECEVVSHRDEDLFELRWLDWPDDPQIVRRRDNLGLLPPTQVG